MTCSVYTCLKGKLLKMVDSVIQQAEKHHNGLIENLKLYFQRFWEKPEYPIKSWKQELQDISHLGKVFSDKVQRIREQQLDIQTETATPQDSPWCGIC